MNLKFVSEIAVVLLSACFMPFFAIKFTFPEGWALDNMPDRLVIRKNTSEVIMISDNILRDDIENGLTPKDYLDQNIYQEIIIL